MHFWITGGTMTFSGGTLGLNGVTVPILGTRQPTKPASVHNPFDTGIPAVAGHYDTESFFPPTFTPPPGVAFVIQVVQLK